MNLINIEARDISDAWFQCLYKILDVGRVFTIDRGSFAGSRRLEFDYATIRIKYPNTEPLVPKIPHQYGIPDPVDEDYLYGRGQYNESYIEYLMTGELKPGESYTYGQRLTKYPLPDLNKLKSNPEYKSIFIQDEEVWNNPLIIQHDDCGAYLNQIELLIWTYKNKGFRNNQMVLQIAHPNDMLLQDPPCFRFADSRIQDNKLHFYVYFRSWSLWGGFPANLAAIENLKQYIAGQIGVENGEIIASSKGLHLYESEFDIAKVLSMKEDMKLKGE